MEAESSERASVGAVPKHGGPGETNRQTETNPYGNGEVENLRFTHSNDAQITWICVFVCLTLRNAVSTWCGSL